jgi:hypothetical protein
VREWARVSDERAPALDATMPCQPDKGDGMQKPFWCAAVTGGAPGRSKTLTASAPVATTRINVSMSRRLSWNCRGPSLPFQLFAASRHACTAANSDPTSVRGLKTLADTDE